MKRNFKPGLRRDIDRINAENGLPAELPPSPPPVEVVDEECGTDLEEPEATPATPAPAPAPAPATTYPLQRDADTE